MFSLHKIFESVRLVKNRSALILVVQFLVILIFTVKMIFVMSIWMVLGVPRTSARLLVHRSDSKRHIVLHTYMPK